MPPLPPQPAFVTRSATAAYDPASASDDEDDDRASKASRSTWASSNPDATILGFADGAAPLELDWRTSRTGGLPTFPPVTASPSPDSADCKLCSVSMPLLAQVYCPLDSSMLERVVYVFACTLKSCRGKEGSIRAWRASSPWIEPEDEVQETKMEEKKEEKKEGGLGSLIFGGGATPVNSSSNPFAAPSSSNPFGTPSSASVNPFAPPPPPAEPVAELSTSLAQTTLNSAPTKRRPSLPPTLWPSSMPHYPAQYLTTSYESTSPTPSVVNAQSVEALMELDEGKHREGKGKGGKRDKPAAAPSSGAGEGWGKEGYEVQKVRGVDDVFLRFQERVARDGCGSQVVRYNYSSQPLPFSSLSPLYAKLFPSPTPEDEGVYTPSKLPACSTCSMPTTFEYQLMPALVGILNKLGLENESSKKDEMAQKAKTKATDTLEDVEGVHALDFATVMVFSCLGECVDEQTEDGWREEVVMIELEE